MWLSTRLALECSIHTDCLADTSDIIDVLGLMDYYNFMHGNNRPLCS